MMRPVSTLPLPGDLLSKLRENGCMYIEDIWSDNDYSPGVQTTIGQWNLTDLDWKGLTKVPVTISAQDVYQEETLWPRIVTFSQTLDDMLEGGIPLTLITELCGAPGTGKTQLCLQLCVDVTIPNIFGGLGGEAIFIDTDSGFSVQRLTDMAESCAQHCHQLTTTHGGQAMDYSKRSILKAIHYVASTDAVHLAAVIQSLAGFLDQYPQVKLVVIDSLAFILRLTSFDSTFVRTGLQFWLLRRLAELALSYKLAVVVTNQLTTRIEAGGSTTLVPALGGSFAHSVHQTILLGHSAKHFVALLQKSTTQQRFRTNFQVTREGVRDR